jgi:phosphoenolpyruvate-protein phosphotransferase
VEVVANIGSLEEAAAALHFGAEGVGLLRTEFLFLGRDQPPSEDEQVQVYRQILEAFAQKPVVIRSLDIGGDKPAPYLQMEAELNPTLGLRGARLALARPEVFQTQLRALLRAGVGHNMKIMFPMLGALAEVQSTRWHLEQARRSLEVSRQDYAADVEVGIMVEIPSAALMADALAQWVDFFSIGSNDLSQYTLAADRTNPHVAGLADALDPAVLRLIDMVTRAAHERGLWVGLCGELAGDAAAAPLLLGLGVDEFSMNPRAIPLVKDALRRVSSEQTRSIAEQALRLSSAGEVRACLQQYEV